MALKEVQEKTFLFYYRSVQMIKERDEELTLGTPYSVNDLMSTTWVDVGGTQDKNQSTTE